MSEEGGGACTDCVRSCDMLHAQRWVGSACPWHGVHAVTVRLPDCTNTDAPCVYVHMSLLVYVCAVASR